MFFSFSFFFFFFNDTATTEIYTLSLHDALPIWDPIFQNVNGEPCARTIPPTEPRGISSRIDRKSTRLNSSHPSISYAVFCLKKKKKKIYQHQQIIITIDSTLYPYFHYNILYILE